MATVPSSTLQLSNPLFPSPLARSPIKHHAPPSLSFTTRATPEGSSSSSESKPDDFEDRLAKVRNRPLSGKRSQPRKKSKSGGGGNTKKPISTSTTSSGSNVFLPPVSLKQPVSGGVKVDFGFSPYSEMMNGRAAALGLTALILVELATGKSVISYHSPSIVFLQVYFVAAVTAVYCKFEKEKISVWPQ